MSTLLLNSLRIYTIPKKWLSQLELVYYILDFSGALAENSGARSAPEKSQNVRIIQIILSSSTRTAPEAEFYECLSDGRTFDNRRVNWEAKPGLKPPPWWQKPGFVPPYSSLSPHRHHRCSTTSVAAPVPLAAVRAPPHYMRDYAWCLTPTLQGRRIFLEMWWLNFLVIRVCYVSRPNAIKYWILKKSHDWVLSTVINCTHPARAEITWLW